MNFLLHFWKQLHSFHMLKKEMSFIAQVIAKLLTRKSVVTNMSERLSFRTPWNNLAILPNFFIFVDQSQM